MSALPEIATLATVMVLLTTAALKVVAALPTTATEARVSAEPATADDSEVTAEPATAADRRVATLPATPALSTVRTVPATPTLDRVISDPAIGSHVSPSVVRSRCIARIRLAVTARTTPSPAAIATRFAFAAVMGGSLIGNILALPRPATANAYVLFAAGVIAGLAWPRLFGM